MVEALMLAHKEIKRLCLWQRELFKALDIQKREFVAFDARRNVHRRN
jgi:polyribonucleotide nucleotidyltransferase